ncbi:hypothetical protein FUAX_22460 [Fulvitalea axinellae]|uniref:TonB-dependent receptor n=1 Tax=Fulvitalea axinellae TaxID=1182444 RepID=A0AAU9D5Q4_9BACT|nr:hypothetical protein FUAX_22460 [Fulvitalea axinellae]
MKYSIVLSLFLLSGATAMAQEKKEEGKKPGSLQDAQFEIIKERKNRVGEADRRYEKIPPQPQLDREHQAQQFDIKDYDLGLPLFSPTIRVLKMKKEKRPSYTPNYVKAGFGSYVSPYLELYLANPKSRDMNWNVRAAHASSLNGPVDSKNSGASETAIDLGGEFIGKRAVLSGNLFYNRRGVHFYGYDSDIDPTPDASDIAQNWNTFGANIGFRNVDRDLMQLDLGTDFYYMKGKSGISEIGWTIGGESEFDLGGDWALGLDGDVIISSLDKPVEKESRSYVSVRPTIKFRPNVFLIEAGVSINYQSDTVENLASAVIAPLLKATYEFDGAGKISAGIRGGVDYNSYQSFVEENPFLADTIAIFNTAKDYELFLEGDYALLGSLGITGGFSYARYTNMPFFVNDYVRDPAQFIIIYDDETDVTKFFADLYYDFQEKFRLTAGLEYNGYSVSDQLKEAWHRPTLIFRGGFDYKITEKIGFNTKFEALTGIKALDEKGEAIDLDAILDLDVKGTYQVNKKISAFVLLDNLLSKDNAYYYRYPTRGLMVMGGVGVSF